MAHAGACSEIYDAIFRPLFFTTFSFSPPPDDKKDVRDRRRRRQAQEMRTLAARTGARAGSSPPDETVEVFRLEQETRLVADDPTSAAHNNGNVANAAAKKPAAVSKSMNEKRRRAEDSLAVVFMAFAAVFLSCHSLRLALDAHELWALEAANRCRAAGRRGFPAWSLVAVHVSHVLTAVNSAVNILVYCGMSSRFREEFGKMFCGKQAAAGARR